MFVEIASLYAGEYIVFCLSWERRRPNSGPNTYSPENHRPVLFSPHSCEIDLEEC